MKKDIIIKRGLKEDDIKEFKQRHKEYLRQAKELEKNGKRIDFKVLAEIERWEMGINEKGVSERLTIKETAKRDDEIQKKYKFGKYKE